MLVKNVKYNIPILHQRLQYYTERLPQVQCTHHYSLGTFAAFERDENLHNLTESVREIEQQDV